MEFPELVLKRLDSNLSKNYNVKTEAYGDLYNIEKTSGINSLVTELTLVFSYLPYSFNNVNEAKVLEDFLKSTKGVKRITYNGEKYVIKSEYTATYTNQYASITVVLHSVGG